MPFQFNQLMRALLASGGGTSVPSFYFNFSNPQNVTLGAAQARGTITSTQNSHITMSASMSRVVGVAPLYVNIDMTGTTSDLTANATHDLFYSVNWGDSGAGQWANGVQSPGLTDKNWSFGPVGGHVFETPGTYLVTPTSTDGVNSAAKPGYVTVLDPNVVYDPAYGAGYETICLSHSGNYTGAPGVSGNPGVSTRPVITGNTDMYSLWNTYKGNNKRILFCKADAWTCSAPIVMTSISGVTIGGYGTGAARSACFSAAGTDTLVSVTPTSFTGTESGMSMFVAGAGSSDLRICNIKINAIPTVFAAAVNATMTGMLYYKVEIRGCAQGWNVSASQNPTSVVPEQVCLYECLADDIYGYAGIDLPSASASGAIGTPGVFTATAHPFAVNYKVRLSGTPPAPLATATDYWITSTNFTANSFTLSSSYANAVAGVALALSGTGTCTVTAQTRGGDVACYVALTNGGIMGSYFDNCNHGEQTMRLPYLDRAHVNNNYIARPNQGKNALKIHSVIHAYFPVWSEKFVVSGNVIDYRNGYSYDLTATPPTTMCPNHHMAIGSGGNGGVGGEWVRNGIVENNLAIGCLGYPQGTLVFASIACPNMTIRNNIADFSVGDRQSTVSTSYAFTSMCMVVIDNGPVEATSGVRIYNNTLYSNLTNPESCQFVRIMTAADTIAIKNNLWYLPNRLENFQYGTYFNNGGVGTGLDSTNNTTSHLANPNFAVQPPVALADWRPTSGYAVSGGATVPVLKDFNQATRTVAALGAVKP